jgi:excisionase family DNA binding protein
MLDLLEDMASRPHQTPESEPPPRQMAAPIPMPLPAVSETPPPLLVSIKEARRLVGLGHSTIYARIADGTLETVRLGSRRLIQYDSLRKLIGG